MGKYKITLKEGKKIWAEYDTDNWEKFEIAWENIRDIWKKE